MPRKPRIQYPGARYHVMCRGNRKEDIFFDDRDRDTFLRTLGEACEQTEWDALRRGWYIGSNTFRDQLIDRMEQAISGRKKDGLGGRMVRAGDEQAARALLGKGLGYFKLDSRQAKALPKNDLRKQGLAWLIRSQTAMKNAWVVETLGMGTRTSVFHAAKRYRNGRSAQIRRIRKALLDLTD